MANTHEPKQGLVISYFGTSVAVESADGQVFQCQLHRNQELPVVGDRVLWQMEESNNCVVTEILPRTSLMSKGDARGKMKAIAANVKIIAVVMAPPPIFTERLIDRYIIAAELLGITPIVIVNKDDLLADSERAELERRLSVYAKIPYQTFLTSMITKKGVAELDQFLTNKTAVLTGPSGVGKSSIISTLSNQDIRVSEVSAKGSGKHTTTATRLYHLPNGGSLIDSPGVRDFNLWPVAKEEILRGFKEFNTYTQNCKFRDCKHLAEPGCGLKTAIEQGNISQERFQSYQQLMNSDYVK